MKVSIGDKVRFLNEVGGGVVTRIDKDIVYVEDDDGFDIPVDIAEVVVIDRQLTETGNVVTNIPVSDKTNKEPESNYQYNEKEDDSEQEVLLALTKGDSDDGNVDLYLINDTNYFAYYTIGNAKKDKITNLYNGMVEPNTKLFLDNLPVNMLDGAKYDIQMIMFQKIKQCEYIAPVSEVINFVGSKLLRKSYYKENDYFDEDAVLFYLLKSKFQQKVEELTQKDIKKIIRQKNNNDKKKTFSKRKKTEQIEIDLHIHELLDNTAGLSNKDMLEVQMNKFREVLNENLKNKKMKIVFIHGIGNGVLKNELRKELERKYKMVSYQDASFKEYGFGATMVVI